MRTPQTSIRGFTLIEMLVVTTIILLVAGISTVGIVATLRANAIDDAVNQVSVALTSARAIAQQTQADTAVIFFTIQPAGVAPVNIWDHTMDLGMRIVQRNNDSSATGFKDFEDRPVDRLPTRIRLRGPTAAGPTWTAPAVFPNGDLSSVQPLAPATWLAVWFGPNGTVQISDSTGNQAIYYDDPRGDLNVRNMLGTDPATTTGGYRPDRPATPIPCLVIYNEHDFEAQGVPINDANVSAWINVQSGSASLKYVRLLAFNRYTGTLMNRPKP